MSLPKTDQLSNFASNEHPVLGDALASILDKVEKASAEEDESAAAEALVALGRSLRDPTTGDETARWITERITNLPNARSRLLLACGVALYRGLPVPLAEECIHDSRFGVGQVPVLIMLTTMDQVPDMWPGSDQVLFWREFILKNKGIMPKAWNRWLAGLPSQPVAQDGTIDYTGARGIAFPLVDSIPRRKASDSRILAALFQRVAQDKSAGEQMLRESYADVDLSLPTTMGLASRLYAISSSATLRTELVTYISHGPEPARAGVLERIFEQEPEETVRAEIVKVIGSLSDQAAESIARRVFEEGQPTTVLFAAIEGLALNSSDGTVEEIRRDFALGGPEVKVYALNCLWKYNPHANEEEKEQILLLCREDADPAVRKAAFTGLGVIGGSKYRDELEAAASSDPSDDVRRVLTSILEHLERAR